MKHVLFVCTHNAGRSQMAEAFVNRLGRGRITAQSAGTQPGDDLNPQVVAAMREIGYDLGGRRPKPLTREMADRADRIITMGCGVETESCPALFLPTEDWSLDDPNGQPIETVRRIRDQILDRVRSLLEAEDLGAEEEV